MTALQLRGTVVESPTMKEFAQGVVASYYDSGGQALPRDGEAVRTSDDVEDEVRLVYDCYDLVGFKLKHQGCTPEELHAPMVVRPHPKTAEPMELHVIQAEPHVQIIESLTTSASQTKSQLQHRVYAHQGRHTWDYQK